MSYIGVFLVLALLGSCVFAQTPEQRARTIVSKMTNSEKYSILNGRGWDNFNNGPGWYIGNTPPVDSQRIPSLNMQDGPQGFRTTNVSQYGQVTSWPCSLGVASTWDADLMRQWATAMGKEYRAKGANQILGPAVNFHRVARGGRNGEYVTGEDPLLGAIMSENYVLGVQSQKVMAVVKHYALNNQETNRDTVSSNIDLRTYHEIYLPAYEAAVRAGVAAFMCSYNLVNGIHSCGNPYILNTVLRDELNFTGWVMSDWWATHGVWCAEGEDQDMPGNYGDDGNKDYYSPENLSKVDPKLIDQMCYRIILSMIQTGAFDNPVCNNYGNQDCDKYLYSVTATNKEHSDLARKIASNSAQLLQNSGILPLDTLPAGSVIGIVGSACNSAYNLQQMTDKWNLGNYYILGGSGRVINPNTVPILTGIQSRAGKLGIKVVYDGSDNVQKSLHLLQTSTIGITCGATTSTEGNDRKNLYVDQDSFISQILASKPVPVVVLLSTPGTVLTDWRSNASAIVNMFLAGQQTGNAWADVLFGDVNPSGKLPVTFPSSEQQTIQPCPGLQCTYSEKLMVGYRGLVGQQVAFPFGHGLSYTNFTYSWSSPPSTSCSGTDVICMEINVQNSGKRDGADVPQVYIDYPAAAMEPKGQLRGFKKVVVASGATVKVKFGLSVRDVSMWNGSWTRVRGMFAVYVGHSSRDIKLSANVNA